MSRENMIQNALRLAKAPRRLASGGDADQPSDNAYKRPAVRLGAGRRRDPNLPANKFIKDFNDSTLDHPFDERSRLLNTKTGLDPNEDFASIELSKFGDDGIHVSSIMATRKGRGQGSQALQYLKNLADKHGVSLHGAASQFGSSGLSTNELKQWYKRHGFEFDRYGSMIRKPVKGED
jgi:hypothetical protein